MVAPEKEKTKLTLNLVTCCVVGMLLLFRCHSYFGPTISYTGQVCPLALCCFLLSMCLDLLDIHCLAACPAHIFLKYTHTANNILITA